MKVEKAVKQVLGREPEKVEEIAEGLKHDTYWATVEGKDYIVQFSGDDYDDHASLRHCLKMYELLSDTVKVPHAATSEVQELDGERYIIVEKLEGQSGEKSISKEKTRKAGKELAKIHNHTTLDKAGWIEFRDEGYEIVEFEEGGLKEHFLTQLEEKLQILRDEGLEELADKVDSFIEEREEVWPENFTPVICHDDFTPDNTIYLNGEVNGIIDIDYAFSGLDARNLVKAANAFWMNDPVKDWPRDKFYQGYSEERPLPENFDELEKFFRVETLVQTVASLIDMDVLTEDQIEFYEEEIMEELE
ncbi:phosphotransferase [Candidatus Nanohaloarchaea archaeon]|nr:phosphotransferase [Candidatus Nanohaloarchaea archaeon]